MLQAIGKILGTKNDREIKRYRRIVEQINGIESALKGLSDDELKQKTDTFKSALKSGTPPQQILPEAFATVREAAVRVLGMRHFDVQLIGGMVLYEGRIAEMKTGEGKTLTATLAAYMAALSGEGAHIVTVNDYLASRDAKEMGKLYEFLGLSTGLIVHGLSDAERQQAYASDVTYGTNNEFGFDYLRDNMKTELSRCVGRGHHFCIVDEVDSILIDEARTPLIISGPAETSVDIYEQANSAVLGLHKDSDYVFDEKSRHVSLTEDGISKIEQRLRVENLYDPSQIDLLHHIQQSLKAHIAFKKDVDYVVKNGKIVIVDEFTGRLMEGRRYSDGLHGALEAKEHVRVENETQVLASITFQNFFRLYSKLSGMTGTADTEAVEFKKIYNLDVVVIPTNRPLIRKDEPDEIYRSAREKFDKIADEIAEVQRKGQPILVGTVSVERSELLASLLRKRNIPHEILNAKNHGREAQIIAEAGQAGRVTISTNMAGRGTDIVLGEGVRELGGLYVMGTERHESRRIDNQLRGRSGRQGDPGRTKFFLSLEDDLLRIFASERLAGFMGSKMEEGEAIISGMVTKAIERAQKRVEEQNFSSRKHVLEYDDVMNQQRQVIYARRRKILEGDVEIDFMEDSLRWSADGIVKKNLGELSIVTKDMVPTLEKDLGQEFQMDFDLSSLFAQEEGISPDAIVDLVAEQAMKAYQDKRSQAGEEIIKQVEAFVYLQIIDSNWKEHLRSMEQLHDSVRLRGYAQRDPLQEYKKEGFKQFEATVARIEDETAMTLLRMPPVQEDEAYDLHVEEPDEDMLTMSRAAQEEMSPKESSKPQEDGMIYFGSRSQGPSEAKPETFVRETAKVGRNDLCPCGSGKKYKKCHGRSTNQPTA